MSVEGAGAALAVLPVLVPLLSAVGCLLVGGGSRRQALVGVGGALLNLAAAIALLALVQERGLVVTHLGGWAAPFGVAFAADRLGALMATLAALVGVAGAAYAVPSLPEGLKEEVARAAQAPSPLRRFMPLLHLMLAGIGGFVLTADLFNLYVFLELTLVSSFGLMVIGGQRRAVEGAAKYFALNIVGSMLLLTGVGLLYAMTGTLNLADLAERLPGVGRPGVIEAIAGVLLVALGIKSAAFPLFFWLPASYHAPPIAITAIFGGILTKVGVYGILRLFTLVFRREPGEAHGLILLIGTATMVAGVLGAVAQHDVRRLLSFHIISQIGYMLIGLGFSTAAGLTGAIFFMAHIVIVKTALFFTSGIVARLCGSYDLERAGGLYAARPAVAALFLVLALSLGGVPPLSGFVAKLAIVQAGLAAGEGWVVGAALAVSVLTLYSMTKIWTRAFWSDAAPGAAPRERGIPALQWIPAAGLCALTVLMGLAAGPLAEYAAAAAADLMDPAAYVEQVLAEARR